MARRDEIELQRRPVAAARLLRLMNTARSERNPGKPITQREMAEILGVDQTRVSKWINEHTWQADPAKSELGAFGFREALTMSALDARSRGRPGLPAHWFLGADVVIENWPSDEEAEWLLMSHPGLMEMEK